MEEREGGKDNEVCEKNEEDTGGSGSSFEEDIERNEKIYR